MFYYAFCYRLLLGYLFHNLTFGILFGIGSGLGMCMAKRRERRNWDLCRNWNLGTGAKHIVTIPLQEISYSELKEDLKRVKGKHISKLSKLPERLARKVRDYLSRNDREDLLEQLTWNKNGIIKNNYSGQPICFLCRYVSQLRTIFFRNILSIAL